MSRTNAWGVRIERVGVNHFRVEKKIVTGEWYVVGYFSDYHEAITDLEKWQAIERDAVIGGENGIETFRRTVDEC
jgi:hypothetical protein